MSNNLQFTPRKIDADGFRPAGAKLEFAEPKMQRLAALRAYAAFVSGRDWMEKLSHAYVVAIATRSADEHLMRRIQRSIPLFPPIECAKCREATIGTKVIRRTLFPTLHALREHANDLLHHLDDPDNKGVATLNVEGVFDYCYHLFEEQAAALFDEYPAGTFELRSCRQHRAAADRTPR